MFRKANSDDCMQIFKLMCDMENRELPFDRFQKIYSDQLQNSNYYCLVECHDKRVIGALNLRFEEQLHHAERIAEIMELVVDSSCRSQGIGKNMLEQACQIAKSYGCSQIEVASNQIRKSAHRFYLRGGFVNSHFKFYKPLSNQNV